MAKVVSEKKPKFGLIMAVYLLGIFMGALDTGIVTPARTIIQESLGVSDTAGIWMITIYTLAYAASIPVMGKLADRVGRRTIYLISIALFGGGSLLCGLSHSFNSFTALLISRAIQAIGGGGIVPIANAEFGTTFPEEKRGMALGLVGGVYGIANIFGASAGSAVMDLFGTDRWEFIFYVNVPIAVFILIAGLFCLPNTKEKATTKIDGLGTCMLVVMVLCIMYGLKNIDFFDFISTLTSISVYPFLIAFAILTPFFIMVEKRADDPILNLKFFTNSRILVTLMVAVITGFVLMAVIFVPQLCENAMKVPTGSGGYFVIALGVCAGLGAPFSGKLTDKFGPKIVLGFGLLVSLIGSLIVIFFTTVTPNKVNVFASLMLIGLGIGFTMGAPLNYMMLWEVPDKEANSALATLSLVRSLGTVVAPAIMVGFIAHAGMGMQDNLMAVMPKEVNIPKLPYAEELSEKMQEQGVEGMPDLASMRTIKIDMSGKNKDKDMDMEIPDEIIDKMQEADVTTIMDSVKEMSNYFFDEMTPKMTKKIIKGINKGISGMDSAIEEMQSQIDGMRMGQAGIQKGIDGISSAISGQSKAVSGMEKGRNKLNTGIDKLRVAVGEMKNAINSLSRVVAQLQEQYDSMPEGTPGKAEIGAKIDEMNSQLGEMRDAVTEINTSIGEMKNARTSLSQNINKLQKTIRTLSSKRNKMISQRNDMQAGIDGIQSGIDEIRDTQFKMKELKAAIPGAFKEAKKDYMAALDNKQNKIETVYQETLGKGFRQMFILNSVASVLGILLLLLYKRKKQVA